MDAKLKKEGWIENNGNRPFNDGTIVDAMFKDGTVALSRYCGGPKHYRFAGADPVKAGNSMWAPNTYRLTDGASSVRYYRVPWKRHRGGKCPVKVGETIEIRTRSLDCVVLKVDDIIGNDRLWKHLGVNAFLGKADIMAYRVIRGIDC